MKQVSSIMKESVWVEDKSSTDCKGCNKPFSVSRREERERGRGREGGREDHTLFYPPTAPLPELWWCILLHLLGELDAAGLQLQTSQSV